MTAGVYVIAHRADDGWRGPCKIGIAKDSRQRLSSLQSGNPYRIGVFGFVDIRERSCARDVEKFLHHSLRKQRLQGEWFQIDPEIALEHCRFAVGGFAMFRGGIRTGKALDFVDVIVQGVAKINGTAVNRIQPINLIRRP